LNANSAPEPIVKTQPSQTACLVILLIIGTAGIFLFLLTLFLPSLGISNLLNFSRREFGDFQINANFTTYNSANGKSWGIDYEKKISSQFSGKVRHTSIIAIDNFPILTHDILITSQDFADPEKVKTSVTDHHFMWIALTKEHPQGTINLLHTVPKNDEIYQQLLKIQPDQMVTISGWEIKRINAYQPDGEISQWWQDTGCNTLLVDLVTVQPDKSSLE
jgi:hypothetical protein